MTTIAFNKYEGLGNDFVLVEADREDVVSSDAARTMCDRRFGVGGDGVILILPPREEGSAARMRVLNADGSIPEMCGNGLRCVALHLARKNHLAEVSIETDAGTKQCRVEGEQITVDMGIVRFLEEISIEENGRRWELALADAGNPHAITVQSVSRTEIERAGPILATHTRFAQGTNVEFAAYRGAEIDLVVWERGVGITLACGTGACATAAVGVARGIVGRNVPTIVHLPGGPLEVTIRDDDRAIMRGPAHHVFSGETR